MIPLGVIASAQAAPSAGSPLTLDFTDSRADPTDTADRTLTGISIGTPSPNRTVIIGYGGRSGTAHRVTSITVNGTPLTLLSDTDTTQDRVIVGYATIPTGNTATVNIKTGAIVVRAGIGVWAAYGAPIHPRLVKAGTYSNMGYHADSLDVAPGEAVTMMAFSRQIGTQVHTYDIPRDFEHPAEQSTVIGAHAVYPDGATQLTSGAQIINVTVTNVIWST